MNYYLVITALAAILGAGWGGFQLGVDHATAAQIDKQQLVAEAVDAANSASAQAISQIKINNTTIKQAVERETHTNTLYVDCRHTDSGLQLINAALGKDKPAASGQLSTPGAPAR